MGYFDSEGFTVKCERDDNLTRRSKAYSGAGIVMGKKLMQST